FALRPTVESTAALAFSPYRYGSAMWTYLSGRFGDRVLREVLTMKSAAGLNERIQKVTGATLDEIFADWRNAAYEIYGSQAAADGDRNPAPLLRGGKAGRVQLGPSISPNGRDAI